MANYIDGFFSRIDCYARPRATHVEEWGVAGRPRGRGCAENRHGVAGRVEAGDGFPLQIRKFISATSRYRSVFRNFTWIYKPLSPIIETDQAGNDANRGYA